MPLTNPAAPLFIAHVERDGADCALLLVAASADAAEFRAERLIDDGSRLTALHRGHCSTAMCSARSNSTDA